MLDLSILLAWLFTDVLATYSVLHNRRAFAPTPLADREPNAAIVVAIKGAGDFTPLFLHALTVQHYRNFRVIFALQSSADDAFPLVTQLQRQLAGAREVTIVIAGPTSHRAQKVHNLLAALDTLRPDDQIVVFADADIAPGATWLSQLIRPVASGETAASCGYRWQLPVGRNLSALIVAAADMSIATAARSRLWNLCWAGSVALDCTTLKRLDLPGLWDRVASDDLTLTTALRSHGLRIYAPPQLLIPSPVAQSWDSMLRFIRRQYLMVRVYAPRHWLLVAWILIVPAMGATVAASALLMHRQWRVLAFVVASIGLLQLRLALRRSIAGFVLSGADLAVADTTVKFARWAWPLIHLVHLAAFASSAVGQRFSWAGIRYRFIGREVVVESGV
jgi:cellulose synthase/poly-beta-1,6-N-acetylglucosamine synthase-like glycosyltransferase